MPLTLPGRSQTLKQENLKLLKQETGAGLPKLGMLKDACHK